ncbi:MAG TPA: alpha/beta hydrolase [Clostridiales bacterium]|nr:alpha/beta hydrolase [Clostridiales bacterium]
MKLWDKIPGQKDGDEFQPTVTPYLLKDNMNHSAVLVCPGGGYHAKAYHEGPPIAGWLNSIGISAFVLDYRVAPNRYPYPQMDAVRAMQILRRQSDELGIYKDKIGILGFSAGGHLAAFLSIHNRMDKLTLEDETGGISYRPDFSILCYPVISSGPYGHVGSMKNLLGVNPDQDLVKLCSLEDHVNSDTPPTFLWHTAEDAGVPVENTLLLASSLSKHKIPFECHIFQKGRHGLGIKYEVPETRQWMSLCEKWLIQNGYAGQI